MLMALFVRNAVLGITPGELRLSMDFLFTI